MFERKEVTILLVEDNPGHARLIEKNLRRANIFNRIITIGDGQKAVDFLYSKGEYEGIKPPTPLLVILDLKLPVLDGYQVLERMKEEDSTRRIPVVVLTTTDDIHEVSRCYNLGVNIYITKPIENEEFAEAIRKLTEFISIIRVPEED